MKLIKTESFEHKNRKQTLSLQVKFLLCSEIATHSENFAIVEKFRYNSEITPVAPACSYFHLLPVSSIQLDAIKDKSYELDVN